MNIIIIDLFLNKNSPVGSCILQEIKGLSNTHQLTVLSSHLALEDKSSVTFHKVSILSQPNFLRYFMFYYLVKMKMSFLLKKMARTGSKNVVIQATSGQYATCDICHTQFCHAAYLEKHWHKVDVKGVRKLLRKLNHSFIARKEKKAFSSAKLIVVPSRDLKNEIKEYYPSTAKKLVTIPNPVDTKRFSRDAEVGHNQRNALGFTEADTVIAFAALGDFERKGLGLLLEALSLLKRDAPRYKILVIGGRGPEIALFQKKASQLGVSGQVVFAGFQKDIRPYFWAADMFSLPSVYEAFSLVCIQAAAAKLPLLVTDISGVNEYVVDNENGWFVERTTTAIAAKLRKIGADKTVIATLGANAEKTAHRYSQEVFQERWLELYSTLAKKEVVVNIKELQESLI
ncbi:glycosyltransferase family 4 protein [Tunicatimonas pelagia]|uniref:glycosyltransferase family 4 protein n=1 Tax=Tunicatimonas pelagia TaxID=931531 RepID=UPI0026666019|nr:glycosyltransferase family 4 protein [Tunicatimonas pelagia]WKN40444.1 glycosyltransferase family 4 protein [Tunicatimonas pelagia]